MDYEDLKKKIDKIKIIDVLVNNAAQIFQNLLKKLNKKV